MGQRFVKTTIYLQDHILNKLKNIATKQNKSLSELIEDVVINNMKIKPKKTQEISKRKPLSISISIDTVRQIREKKVNTKEFIENLLTEVFNDE